MNRKLITALKIVAPLAVVAVAAFSAVTLAGMRPAPVTQRVQQPAPLVRTATVRIQDLQLTVLSQGTVSPRTESRVVPEVAGRVVWVSPAFVSGGFFETGTPLLRIETIDYEQAVVRAEAEVAAARLRLAQEEAEARVAREEWEELGSGEAPDLTARVPQLENARAAVTAAAALVTRAHRDLDRTEIRAPYAGRVRDKRVDVGQFVHAGADLGSIYAIDAAEVRLPLADDELAFLDLPLLYRGQSGGRGPKVRLIAEFAGKTHEWEGRIVRTEGEIDPTTRMVHAVAQVADPYRRGRDPQRPPLAAGMYVRAEIEGIRMANVAEIPRAAIRVDGRVLVVDSGNRLYLRDVEVARATRDTAVVRAGLADGERVVVSALDAVTNGMLVRVGGDQGQGR